MNLNQIRGLVTLFEERLRQTVELAEKDDKVLTGLEMLHREARSQLPDDYDPNKEDLELFDVLRLMMDVVSEHKAKTIKSVFKDFVTEYKREKTR